MSQDKLPYYEITESYEEYTAGTVTARMLDGLGFRFYWATEAINEGDLSYKPSDEGRTFEQTVDHILGLSRVIVNSALKQPNENSKEHPEMTYKDDNSVLPVPNIPVKLIEGKRMACATPI